MADLRLLVAGERDVLQRATPCRPRCTFGRLNESWLKTRASDPSCGAFVQSLSASSQWIGAGGGRSPGGNGDRNMHSMIASSTLMPLRTEPVDDAVERTPRMEVGEQREVEAVVDLGVRQRLGGGAEHRAQLVAAALGGDLAGGAAPRGR